MGLAGALGMRQARPCYWSQTLGNAEYIHMGKYKMRTVSADNTAEYNAEYIAEYKSLTFFRV